MWFLRPLSPSFPFVFALSFSLPPSVRKSVCCVCLRSLLIAITSVGRQGRSALRLSLALCATSASASAARRPFDLHPPSVRPTVGRHPFLSVWPLMLPLFLSFSLCSAVDRDRPLGAPPARSPSVGVHVSGLVMIGVYIAPVCPTHAEF